MSFIFKGSLEDCAVQQEKQEESDQETNKKCLEEKNNIVMYRKRSKVRCI